MDWLDFAASVIHSLAWPATIFLAILLVRRSVIDLIPRLSKVRYKELELIIEQRISEASREVQASPDAPALPPAKAATEATKENQEIHTPSYFEAIAEISPRAALLEAWHFFEATATKAAVQHGLMKQGQGIEMQRLLQELRRARLLTMREANALSSLRRARNAVVHAAEVEVPREQVAQYAEMVSKIAAQLRKRSDTSLEPRR